MGAVEDVLGLRCADLGLSPPPSCQNRTHRATAPAAAPPQPSLKRPRARCPFSFSPRRYQEVLTQYAHDDPDALPGDSGFEELKKKHEAMPLHIMFGGRR